MFVVKCLMMQLCAAKWPLRAPHRNDVPASFDCEMRKAAYSYGKHLLPRLGDFESLYYALDLNGDDCSLPRPGSSAPSRPDEAVPADSFFVAPLEHTSARKRSLTAPVGSIDNPFTSIQEAADVAARSGGSSSKTVVLRGGVHSIRTAIRLGPEHSGLSLVAYPSEAPVVTGATRLSGLDWKPFDTPGPDSDTWKRLDGQNAVYGGQDDNRTYHVVPGETSDAAACEAACKADPRCQVWTWHDGDQGSYALQCWLRLDGVRTLRAEAGHTSGYNESFFAPNIWVADVKGQVTDVPGLQLDGQRATRARYPNLPGGIEVSPGYDGMISENDAAWTPPDFDKYGAVDFYTDNITSHDRPNAGWFEHYMIGTDGLCSVYDPPVSYWCSEHPSGGGAFAFRTPSGVTPKAGALPNSPYKDVSEAIFNVWRPARWANWMFKVGQYDRAANNFTFGYGGFQGARGNNNGGDFFVENVLEELDNPGEFYFDKKGGKLLLYHNGTGAPPASAVVVAPQLKVLLNASGTQWNPVRNVSLEGIKYTSAAYTYMEPHGPVRWGLGTRALRCRLPAGHRGGQDPGLHLCPARRQRGDAVWVQPQRHHRRLRL
jgi:hypothetical protein